MPSSRRAGSRPLRLLKHCWHLPPQQQLVAQAGQRPCCHHQPLQQPSHRCRVYPLKINSKLLWLTAWPDVCWELSVMSLWHNFCLLCHVVTKSSMLSQVKYDFVISSFDRSLSTVLWVVGCRGISVVVVRGRRRRRRRQVVKRQRKPAAVPLTRHQTPANSAHMGGHAEEVQAPGGRGEREEEEQLRNQRESNAAPTGNTHQPLIIMQPLRFQSHTYLQGSYGIQTLWPIKGVSCFVSCSDFSSYIVKLC